MKHICKHLREKCIFIFFVVVSLHSKAQISDAEAMTRYEKAAELFQANKFHDCSVACNNLMDSMHKSTPKVMYLYIRSIYENYTNKNDSSTVKYKNNYRSFTDWLAKCDQFFGSINQSTYPKEKFDDITKAKTYFLKMQKEFEYEKDRTPQDAVDFLNECAEKFKQSNYFIRKSDGRSKYLVECISTKFSLEDYRLVVTRIYFVRNYVKKNIHQLFRYKDVISLRNSYEIGIPKNNNNAINKYILGNYISGTNQTLNKFVEFYDNHIFWHEKDTLENRDFDISIDTVFKNDPFHLIKYNDVFNGKNKTANDNLIDYYLGAYQIYSAFDTKAEEFIKGNYEKRIRDAFQYLIDYFPKFPIEESKPVEVVRPKF